MIFLVDNQLPPALARALLSAGLACVHVQDIGMAEASDGEIWDYANRKNCVVISKDEDFLFLASTRPGKAQLIWIRLGNCRTPTLIAAWDKVWPRVADALATGDRVVELR